MEITEAHWFWLVVVIFVLSSAELLANTAGAAGAINEHGSGRGA